MNDKDLIWNTESEQKCFTTPVFQIVKRSMTSPDSAITDDFFIMESPDWVNVVAIREDGKYILVNQYRFGTQALSLEVAGGVVDQGETHLEAARRELLEETGYISETWSHLLTIAPNPALNSNRCAIFLAESCRYIGSDDHDDTEFIQVVVLDKEDCKAAIHDGRIHHALAVAGLGIHFMCP
jgi:ADP-ribose pyrophosphatase